MRIFEENLGKEIERVKSGKEYAEREKLVLEKEETERKLKEISEKLNGLLDKKVLEKYIYLDLDGKGIAEKYADDLIQALIEDSELKILSVIAEIRGKISSGEISVKNSAKVFEKLGAEKALLTLRIFSQKTWLVKKILRSIPGLSSSTNAFL